MSLQDDSSALRKNLEAEIGDKIKLLDREIGALLQSGIIKIHFKLARKHLTLRCRMRLEARSPSLVF